MENIKNLRFSNPEKLLSTFGITGIPEIVKLARTFDLDVHEISGYELRERKTGVENMSGCIEIENPHSRLIVLNDKLVPWTKRFLCAYLLSDYQLNCCPGNDYANIIYNESIYDKSVYSYALRLLMPKHLFDSDLPYIEDYDDIQKLTKKYQVSEYLIRERGKMYIKQKKLKDGRKGFTVL